ncbi:MAG: hypothetical protein AAFX05_02440 [Planctomycetota bacterium]
MRPPSHSLARWVRARPAVLPLLLLLATWIPGMDQGWPRTDAHLYTGVALLAYESGDLWTLHAGSEVYFNKPPAVWEGG